MNRVSFGVQSMEPRVLAALGRTHDPANVERAVALARDAGIARINLDLIYGAAEETGADWQRSLDGVIALDVEHVSAYALTVEPATPLGRAVAAGTRTPPDDDRQADAYAQADDALTAAGFAWYEVSNWARPGEACRHNLLYWTEGEYVGIGCAAHGHTDARRWWNVRTPERYIAAVRANTSAEAGDEQLEPAARAEEAFTLALRTRAGADLADSETVRGVADELADAGAVHPNRRSSRSDSDGTPAGLRRHRPPAARRRRGRLAPGWHSVALSANADGRREQARDRPMTELDERKAAVLRAIVEQYVDTAQPVGSQTVTQTAGLGVSAATVRNEMSVLEREGYITQPHTSAGRVPTDRGYRFYVDHLAGAGQLAAPERRRIAEFFTSATWAMDELLNQTSQLLARVTAHAAVVVGPESQAVVVRGVSLVQLQPRVLLLVVVMSNGAVEKEVVPLDADASEADDRGRERATRAATRRMPAHRLGRVARSTRRRTILSTRSCARVARGVAQPRPTARLRTAVHRRGQSPRRRARRVRHDECGTIARIARTPRRARDAHAGAARTGSHCAHRFGERARRPRRVFLGARAVSRRR